MAITHTNKMNTKHCNFYLVWSSYLQFVYSHTFDLDISLF
jgi:hypothetical protein